MSHRSFIQHMLFRWKTLGDFREPLVGCSQHEIAAIQRSQHVEYLPKLYVEFMQQFGKASGGLTHGGEFRYPHVKDFKKTWSFLNQVTEQSFVFISDYSNSMGLFFQVSQGDDDPVISLINEGENDLEIKDYGRLSDFFVGWVEEEIETNKVLLKRQDKL